MSVVRRGDLYWGVPLLLLFVLLSRKFRPPAWMMVEPASGEQASRGLHLERLLRVEFEIPVLGGKRMRVRARRGVETVRSFGPLALAGPWQGFRFEGISAELPEGSLLLEAASLEVTETWLRFAGAVRLTTKSGQGILYSPKLDVSLPQDLLRSEGLCILAPVGEKGGRGGKALGAISCPLDELRKLAGR